MSTDIRENSSPKPSRRLRHSLYWLEHRAEEEGNRLFNAPKRARRQLDNIRADAMLAAREKGTQ